MNVELVGGPFDGDRLYVENPSSGNQLHFPGIDASPELLNYTYKFDGSAFVFQGEQQGFTEQSPSPEYARQMLEATLSNVRNLRLKGHKRMWLTTAQLEAMLVLLLESSK